MNIIYSRIKNISPRSILVLKNIGLSFVYKFIIILLNLYIVRLSLQYLGQENYGIWLTIGAMINWFEISDLGLGHGLRNKLAKSLASEDYILAKKYVSTTYLISIIISILLILIFSLIIYNLDLHVILNTNPEKENILKSIAIITFMSFAVRLTLKLFSSILLADQRPSFRVLLQLIFKSIMVIGLIFTLKMNYNNLINYAFIFSIPPLIIYLIISLIFYNGKYKKIRPSTSSFDKTKIKSLTVLGFNFLLIQLSAIILFQTDNFLIIQLYSASEVSQYHIINQYYSSIVIILSMVITPYWSAFTNAYEKYDLKWIKNSEKGLLLTWLFFCIASIFLYFISDFVMTIWIGKNIQINSILEIIFLLYTILHCLNLIYGHFLNGMGKVKLQVYLSIFNIVIHIPLAIFFAVTLKLGIAGIIFSTVISVLTMLIFRIIQFRKIIYYNDANSIWNE